MRSCLSFTKRARCLKHLSNEISPFGFCTVWSLFAWGVCAGGVVVFHCLWMVEEPNQLYKPKVERVLNKRKQKYVIPWSDFYLTFEMECLCPNFGVSTTALSL